MSDDASKLIMYMCRLMSEQPYLYDIYFDGCYDGAIEHYGFKEPEEGREFVIVKVKEVLSYYE